ncbi:MAG: guanylate kinase [Bacilli bacterium]|nr:guanylate kinase [Bacilli bacterium]
MIIIVGPSASGKTEVAKILKKDYDIKKAVTHTTRQPRQGERNGVDYYFVNEETFDLLKKSDAFVETTTYDDHHYGCSKAQVSENKCAILDPNGLKTFKKLKNDLIVSFQLMAAPKTRETRMRLRGDKEGDIYMRIMKDQYAFSSKKLSGYVDYKIKTDKKTPQQVAEEIYDLYLEALRNRGLKPISK